MPRLIFLATLRYTASLEDRTCNAQGLNLDSKSHPLSQSSSSSSYLLALKTTSHAVGASTSGFVVVTCVRAYPTYVCSSDLEVSRYKCLFQTQQFVKQENRQADKYTVSVSVSTSYFPIWIMDFGVVPIQDLIAYPSPQHPHRMETLFTDLGAHSTAVRSPSGQGQCVASVRLMQVVIGHGYMKVKKQLPIY